MLRPILVLIAVAGVPLLLAPPTEGCPLCDGKRLTIPLSIERGEGFWREVEVQPKARYSLQLDTLSGESVVELFSLNPKAGLADLKCSGDAKRSNCTFRTTAHGLLGIYVEPKTRVADALLELTQQ